MAEIFLKVVNMSISASYLVLAVLVLRLLLKKSPKWIHVLLWALVGLRLVLPFTLESALSLLPSGEVISPEIMTTPQPTIHTGIEGADHELNPYDTESYALETLTSANPLQILIPILGWNWVLGMGILGLYTLITYVQLRWQVRTAIRAKDDIYLCEYIHTPFVLGLFQPKIYLPYHMEELDQYHVIAHERTHILRKDHWWKPLGFALLTLHWFNPLMWLAYVLLCRDIELACDERVISAMRPSQRANYSQALLNCSVHEKTIAACPVAFGEVGVKERVKRVLHYQKPGFWVLLIAVIACLALAVGFLTDPVADDETLAFLQELEAGDVAQIEFTHYARNSGPYERSYTGDDLAPLLELLNQVSGRKITEPDIYQGSSFCYTIELRDDSVHILSNPNSSYLLVDGSYYEVSPEWLTELESLPFQMNWGVSMVVDWATPTTAALHFVTPTEDIFTGHGFSIQEYVAGNWVEVEPLTPAYVVTTENFSLPTDYFGLDWSELYGPLAPGKYRIEKKLTRSVGIESSSIMVYGEFTIEEPSTITESPVLTGQRQRDREQVCVAVTTTQPGYPLYYPLEDQESAKAALETAMAAVQPGGINSAEDLGLRVEYQDTFLYLAENGTFFAPDQNIPKDAAEPLYLMALETARICGWQEAVRPGDITDIRSATLDFYETVTITDETKLGKLEAMLSGSEYLYGGAGCPFGNLLTLELENGEILQLSMAADSCGAWMSNGVYYRFGSGNEEFYTLFSSLVIHSRLAQGYGALGDLVRYLDWADYANTYGPDETFAFIEALFDYAAQDPSRERLQYEIFPRCMGIDGAYAAYFGVKLEELYFLAPEAFSDTCLNYIDGTPLQDTVLFLLADQWGTSTSDAAAILRANLPE